MSKDGSISVKGTVHKLQTFLLEGINNEEQLFAAGSLMSRSDYEDVVIERSIAKLCGYPLCTNPLPSDPPYKGRYRISLKEHKVYDLHETYMYCSPSCIVSSRAFGSSLQEERCSVRNPTQLNQILRMFDNINIDSEGFGEKGDLGLSNLKIQEKMDTNAGEVSLEEWIGPSNAIEGYVPQRDRHSVTSPSKPYQEGSTSVSARQSSKKDSFFNDMDFSSIIITSDEYNISKATSGSSRTTSNISLQEQKGKESQGLKAKSSSPGKQDSVKTSRKSKAGKSKKVVKDEPSGQDLRSPSNYNAKAEESEVKKAANLSEPLLNDMDFSSIIITSDEYNISKAPSGSSRTTSNIALQEQKGKESQGLKAKSSSPGKQDSVKTSRKLKTGKSKEVVKDEPSGQDLCSPSNYNAKAEESEVKKAANLSEPMLKPSLKSSGAKKSNHSVTWADDNVDNAGGRNLCEVREMKDKEHPDIVSHMIVGDDGKRLHVESAEACAVALTQAAAAVASGDADASDAIAAAGVTILPHPQDLERGELTGNVDMIEEDSVSLKWPLKTRTPGSELFDSEDSWFDAPPEGFHLSLSPFATMWMALFAWVTSSSLAYIYGSDESSHEDYLSVNGREYPRKTFLQDGRSSEIKLTVAGCLARAFPGIVAELGLRIPVSSLEKKAAGLLETMSFVDAVPAFRTKQWQVFAFLFVEALSVCRIPSLTSYMTSRRLVLHQVLDGARISAEEYEVMKDLMMPLGRVPQARSGA